MEIAFMEEANSLPVSATATVSSDRKEEAAALMDSAKEPASIPEELLPNVLA